MLLTVLTQTLLLAMMIVNFIVFLDIMVDWYCKGSLYAQRIRFKNNYPRKKMSDFGILTET